MVHSIVVIVCDLF